MPSFRTRIANELGATRHALDQRMSIHACYLPTLGDHHAHLACLPLNDARRVTKCSRWEGSQSSASRDVMSTLGCAGGGGGGSAGGEGSEGNSKGAGVLMEAMRTWGIVAPLQVLAIGMDPRDSRAAMQAGALYIDGRPLLSVLNPKDYIEHPDEAGPARLSKAPAPFDPALRGRSGKSGSSDLPQLQTDNLGGESQRGSTTGRSFFQGPGASDTVLQID